jgi:hypothetical protein
MTFGYRYAGNEYVTAWAYDPGRGRTLRLGSDVNFDGTPFRLNQGEMQ